MEILTAFAASICSVGVLRTLARLWLTLADTTKLTESTPAATARSAPLGLGENADRKTSGLLRPWATNSTASAYCGNRAGGTIGRNAKAAQGMPGVAGAVTYDGERERGEYRGGCSEHVDDQAHAGIVTREAVQAHFLSGW